MHPKGRMVVGQTQAARVPLAGMAIDRMNEVENDERKDPVKRRLGESVVAKK